MTVAIRLRCTCRRTLATLDHGADRFEVADRERQSKVGLINATYGEVGVDDILGWSFPIASMDKTKIRCRRCRQFRRFSAAQLEEAKRRAQRTGKPADIIANDP